MGRAVGSTKVIAIRINKLQYTNVHTYIHTYMHLSARRRRRGCAHRESLALYWNLRLLRPMRFTSGKHLIVLPWGIRHELISKFHQERSRIEQFNSASRADDSLALGQLRTYVSWTKLPSETCIHFYGQRIGRHFLKKRLHGNLQEPIMRCNLYPRILVCDALRT
jgi:hypothetical protein